LENEPALTENEETESPGTVKIESISTVALLAELENPDFCLLDARPSAAYNGWALRDEARGGHLPGAVSFPVEWTRQLNRAEVLALLRSKGVEAHRTVVLYGFEGMALDELVEPIQELDIGTILHYQDGMQGWAAEAGFPIDRLARCDRLVYAGWIAEHLSGSAPAGFAIYEVTSGGRAAYQGGHIPGAMHLDLMGLERLPLWNVIPDGELLEALPAVGITAHTPVVLYSRDPLAAARAAWILTYAGVQDVRVLDGGLRAWTQAGYSLETGEDAPNRAGGFGLKAAGQPGVFATTEGIRALLTEKRGLLVCVRSWAEHVGETSGYEFIQARGRIPGSLWGTSGSDPHHMQDYRNFDGSLRAYPEIEAIWRNQGITREKRVVFYCGTGWRASEAWFCAYLMGWPQAAVYDGGWLEWSLDPANPVERGDPDSRPFSLP
jgi:molybdopterin synthase sulfurtransferase